MQRTEEWKGERLGVITGTKAHNLLNSDITRATLMSQLIREIALAESKEIKQTPAMKRGADIEDEAVSVFEMIYGCEVTDTDSYIVSDMSSLYACSPDGLIGDDSGLEIKRLDEENHIKVMLAHDPANYKNIDVKYRHQIEWCMFVTGRSHWSYFGYCETLPEKIRCYRKDFYLTSERHSFISKAAFNFSIELNKNLERFGLSI